MELVNGNEVNAKVMQVVIDDKEDMSTNGGYTDNAGCIDKKKDMIGIKDARAADSREVQADAKVIMENDNGNSGKEMVDINAHRGRVEVMLVTDNNGEEDVEMSIINNKKRSRDETDVNESKDDNKKRGKETIENFQEEVDLWDEDHISYDGASHSGEILAVKKELAIVRDQYKAMMDFVKKMYNDMEARDRRELEKDREYAEVRRLLAEAQVMRANEANIISADEREELIREGVRRERGRREREEQINANHVHVASDMDAGNEAPGSSEANGVDAPPGIGGDNNAAAQDAPPRDYAAAAGRSVKQTSRKKDAVYATKFGLPRKEPQEFHRLGVCWNPDRKVSNLPKNKFIYWCWRFLEGMGINGLVKDLSLRGKSLIEIYVAGINLEQVVASLNNANVKYTLDAVEDTAGVAFMRNKEKAINRLCSILSRHSIVNLRECILMGFEGLRGEVEERMRLRRQHHKN